MDKFSCYLCGCKKYFRRKGRVRDMPNLEVRQCEACGLVCLSSFDHISDAIYAESAMHRDQPVSENLADEQELNDIIRRFRDLSPYIVGKKLLDFGCGNGRFLALCKILASSVHGVELDKKWSSYFKRLDIAVVPTLDALPQKYRFEVITMLHVLEHLPDPLKVLKKIHNRLDETSLLIIEVPNAEDALLTLYNCEPFSEFTYWSFHLFLYTQKTLCFLLAKAGFTCITCVQVQRYPLANHLYWLSQGKPGGQKHWDYLNNSVLNSVYAATLAEQGKCDTIIGIFKINNTPI